MVAAVVARSLTKRYGDFCAVDAIDFEVRRGECFGMLGPNGAGKTSTMRMIGCVSPVTAGSLEVLGTAATAANGRRVKARLGVVPQGDDLDDELTVVENLVVYAGYHGIRRRRAQERARDLLEFMSLADRAGDKVRTLSGGMKRRLVVARALVNEPEVVLLDEPTTGLDPQARHHIWERLRSLKDGGATLLLTTHYMEEAAQLCDRLVIMDRGRILVQGSPRELVRSLVPPNVVEIPSGVLDGRPVSGDLGEVQVLPDRVLVHAEDGRRVVDALAADGLDTATVMLRMSTLEDVFLRLTGRDLSDAGGEAG